MTIEVIERTLDIEIHQKLPSKQAFELLCGTYTVQILEPPLQVTSIEDVVLVEEAILDAQETIKDPILLITIEDSSTQSTIEVMAHEPQQ